MSHRSHRRASGRTPTADAEQDGIRFVTSDTTDVYDAHAADQIREMCRAFETDVDPLDAEQTISRMHGRMWELRRQATTELQPDWSFGLGAPFARQLARVGGPGAKGLLFGLGHQSPAKLRELCFGLAFDLPVRMPTWATDLTRAELTRALVTPWDQPEQLVLLEFARRRHRTFTVAVMINDAKGGIARHYGLMRALREIVATDEPDGGLALDGLGFEPCSAEAACRRVRTAVDRADAADMRLVDRQSTKELRALTLSRVEPYLVPAGNAH